MEPFKLTRPGQAYEGPHIGRLLAKKLDTHRWHVLRIEFLDEPQPENYEAVVAAKTRTPYAIKKLMAKAWCALRPSDHVAQSSNWNFGRNGRHWFLPRNAWSGAVIRKTEPRLPDGHDLRILCFT